MRKGVKVVRHKGSKAKISLPQAAYRKPRTSQTSLIPDKISKNG